MSRLEPGDKIEAIVGAKRHPTYHLGRAVSAEQRVYVLHSAECAASGIDLRDCQYSEALDLGIDLDVWGDCEDRPVRLLIDPEHYDLLPMSISSADSGMTADNDPALDEHRDTIAFLRENAVELGLADRKAADSSNGDDRG